MAIWITVGVSIIGIIVIPTLALVIQLAMRWSRMEDRQTTIMQSVEKLAENSDKRIRWLEENFWRRRSLSSCYHSDACLLPTDP